MTMGGVLIIDDDESTREFIVTALAGEGYQTIAANDGITGLEIAAAQRPEMILLDYKMPGMDGKAFISTYRQSVPAPHAVVIVLSAATLNERTVAGMQVDAFLPKPFDLDTLLAVIGQFSNRLAGTA